MPPNYTKRRLIGWFTRSGGAVNLFHTYLVPGGGLEMNWDVPALEINNVTTLTNARRLDAMRVPVGFSVIASINFQIVYTNTTTPAPAYSVNICCPDQADAAVALGAAPLGAADTAVQGIAMSSGPQVVQFITNVNVFNLKIRTNANRQIASRSNVAGAVTNYYGSTAGFTWAR
jgi:hypothetical protein